MDFAPGPRNLITDVVGLSVGNASDAVAKSGTTVLCAEDRMTAAVHVMGGAPGTRETDLLNPENLVDQIDALVLSGGSAFGLDAAQGVMDALRSDGRGFVAAGQIVPIVPAAILFDLANGGDTSWAHSPYSELGRKAYGAANAEFELGSVGAGTGATTANLKGGLGSASCHIPGGGIVGALIAANPVGSVTVGEGPHFWAAPFEQKDEFGGKGPTPDPGAPAPSLTKIHQREATVIGVVATDLALSKAQLKRMAIAAHDGIARAVVPSHTPFDGDLLFAVSTGTKDLTDPLLDPIHLGHAAALCVSRSIARAVFLARPSAGDPFPTWKESFG